MRKLIESAVFSDVSGASSRPPEPQAVGASLRAKAVLDLSPAGAAAKLIVSLDARLATETKMTRLVPIRVHVRAAALVWWRALPGCPRRTRPWPKEPRSRTRLRRRPRRMMAATPSTARAKDFVRLDSRTGQVVAMRLVRDRLVLQGRARRARGARKRDRPAAARQCRVEEVAAGARPRTAERHRWPKLRRRRGRSRRATCRTVRQGAQRADARPSSIAPSRS